jgi:hypothetical protein
MIFMENLVVYDSEGAHSLGVQTSDYGCCLVFAQDCPTKILASQYFGWAIPCPQVGQHWLKTELELVVGHWHANKVGNYPNKNQSFGHDQRELVGVHLSSNPNIPDTGYG